MVSLTESSWLLDSRQEAAKQRLNVSDQISNRPRLCHLHSTDCFVQLESETLVFPDTMSKWENAICAMFVGDGLVSICLNAAAFSLVMIAVERYVKIVHPVKHRSHFSKVRIHVLCLFQLIIILFMSS